MDRRNTRTALGVLLACLLTALAQADWLRGEFKPLNRTQSFRPPTGLFVPRLAAAPTIDGKLTEAVWKRAARVPRLARGTTRPRGRTQVLLLADKQTVFVAFVCLEPRMKRIKTTVKPSKNRGAPVWTDDSVELFIDPCRGGRRHYQFITNALGVTYYAENGGLGLKWEGDFRVAAHRANDRWTLEYAVPFATLGIDGSNPNTPLRMQFCRTAPPRGEMTSWRQGWNDPKLFGSAIVERRGDTPSIPKILLGNVCRGENLLWMAVRNFPTAFRYEAVLKLGDDVLRIPFEGGSRAVMRPYRIDAENSLLPAQLTVTRRPATGQGQPEVVEAMKSSFRVPLAAALGFRNAHVAEGGKTKLWIRLLTGDAKPMRFRAETLGADGRVVRKTALPLPPKGAGEGWFDFSVANLAPGPYGLRVVSEDGAVSATGRFRVERVATPRRAQVPIHVDEPVGQDWSGFPVSVGVPFPRATLDSVSRVRILDGAGKEVPAQITRTSTWNPDGRDVRWLLADFMPTAAKGRGAAYRLEFGRDVRRAAVAEPVRVQDGKDRVRIDTGRLRLVIDRRKATILSELSLDGKPVLTAGGSGAWLQDDRRVTYGSAWDREPPKVTVEATGPIRATVRQQGWYASRKGQRLCRYDIRIHAFAGQPFLKVLHTWVLTHDSRKVRFGDISLRLGLAGRVRKCAFGVDPEHAKPAFQHALTDRGTTHISLIQEDSDRFAVKRWVRPVAHELLRGVKAGGWVGAWMEHASVTAHLRQLWQHYPAELEVTPDALAVHFWPRHGFHYRFRDRPDRYGVHRWPYTDGPFMDLQPKDYVEKTLMKDVEKIKGYDRINALGMSKTQEVWLDFRPASWSVARAQDRARRYERPLAARADAAWIAKTRVFRPFLPLDTKTFPRIEEQIRARWEGNTYLLDRCHDYGWLHFGDRHSQSVPFGKNARFKRVHRYWLVSDYRCGMEPWLLWARSGDRLYYDWAEIISRHVMDVDILHWTGEDVGPPRRKGQFYPMSFAHYCSAPTSMSLHNDPIGFNMMYYYLTGYRRALDVLTACGERELECDLARSRMHRGHAVTGHNQLDMYRITWRERHWDSAWKATTKMLDAMNEKTYLDPTYVYEFLHDLDDFTGDSRVRRAVLNIADNIIGNPLGSRNSYPAVYVFGHAYELTGDPKYIAWGKGKLEMNVSNVNTSANPERRGRVTAGDNIHFTRLMRQVPGFLHYLKEAEAKRGTITRRTEPNWFIYEKGPVYLRKDEDRAFALRVKVRFSGTGDTRGDVTVTAPNGKVVARTPVDSTRLLGRNGYIELTVPADGMTGVYRLDMNFDTMVKRLQGFWGIISPDVRKVAYNVKKVTFWGGHVFFYVPKGAKSFRVRVAPRGFAAPYGQPVLLAPDGRQHTRLDGMNLNWVTVRPKPEDTGGLWGLVLFHIGEFEIAGVPPYLYSDPSEFFIPEGPLVGK